VGNNGNVSDFLHVEKLKWLFEIVCKGMAKNNTNYA
jgi:hypothetical protein